MRNAIFFNGGFEEIGISFWPKVLYFFALCGGSSTAAAPPEGAGDDGSSTV